MLTLVARRAPSTLAGRAALLRAYTADAGSVAKSGAFGKKEKAHEDEYARKHEAELLRKLRAEIEAKKRELAELESKVKDSESK
ncbi:hypothetical protein BU15DRAFT_74578 [Melanogaster broomeanus]|nr:hypothetical protein BU15DRAFT_74578 [Melanogaster broomeanus]